MGGEICRTASWKIPSLTSGKGEHHLGNFEFSVDESASKGGRPGR